MAFAKLGDAESRHEIRDWLKSGRVDEIVQGIQSISYMGRDLADEFANELLPLLEDKRPVVPLGPSHDPRLTPLCEYVLNKVYDLNLALEFVYMGRKLTDGNRILEKVQATVSRAAKSESVLN